MSRHLLGTTRLGLTGTSANALAAQRKMYNRLPLELMKHIII